jgi:hypothetical protein
MYINNDNKSWMCREMKEIFHRKFKTKTRKTSRVDDGDSSLPWAMSKHKYHALDANQDH